MHGWQERWRNLLVEMINMIGREQFYNSNLSYLERIYVLFFGIPIIGLRIRARNIFQLIPQGIEYKYILDAGCGIGVFSFALSNMFRNSVIYGIDILDNAIQTCNSIKKRLNIKNIAFVNSHLEKWNASIRFNLIICVDILEHIKNDLDFLIKLFSMMHEKGYLILHVPAIYRRYPVFKKSLNFQVQTHVRIGYEINAIKEKVESAGFKIKKIGYTYGFWETLANNISYMITKARMERKMIYSILFPFLMTISLLGYRARPRELGAGIYVLAKKR